MISTCSLASRGDVGRNLEDDVMRKPRHQERHRQRHKLKQIPRRAMQTISTTYEEVKINLAKAKEKRTK